MTLTSYFKKLLWLAGLAVAVLLAEGFLIWWLIGRITERAEDIEAKRADLVQSAQERFAALRLKQDAERASEFLPRLRASLPSAEQLFDLVSEINRVAERSGLRQTLVLEGQFPRPSDTPGAAFMPFSAALTGSYPALKTYLRELDALPFFVSVKSVAIESVGANDSIFAESSIRLAGDIHLGTTP